MKGEEHGPEAGYGQGMRMGLPSVLFLLAFAAIFIGLVILALGSLPNPGSVSGGAVILIGPIPIILGSGPYSFVLAALAVVLTIIAAVLFLAVRRR